MRHLLLLAVCGAGCAAPGKTPPPAALPFAARALDRPAAVEAPAPEAAPSPVARAPAYDRTDEVEGLLAVDPERLAALRAVAADDARLDALLAEPLSRPDLEALAWLRAPAVRAARARIEAVRTGFAQSKDLRDLVATYRSYLRETKTRIGPEASRRSTATIAPSPNVDALSAEIVAHNLALAFEDLRRVVRDTVAAAERAHADAARLAAARRVLTADVALHEALVAVVRARFEAGRATQTGLLAFEARLAALRTELATLADDEEALRARWNRLLSRAPDAPLALAVEPAAPAPDAPLPAATDAVARALAAHPEHRAAQIRVARARDAVRLAETMTLPRFDVGSSRFERERAGEASVQRGAVFPEPGRMVMPRADFGVREAQVAEMRARLQAARDGLDASRDATRSGVRQARAALASTQRRWLVHARDLVPLAERALDAARGAYESNRAGYLELLDAARLLLQRRLAAIDARRAHAHAHAALLEAVGARLDKE